MTTTDPNWAHPQTTRPAARGSAGVAAGHEMSVRAGLKMLEAGGNAVDSAVAAALVAGVVEPQETTLGGSGFLLLQQPGKEARSIEFGPLAPGAARPNMFPVSHEGTTNALNGVYDAEDNSNRLGPLASGIPRNLPGLLTAHERYGRLSRAEVMKPAIEAAFDGFPAYLEFAIAQAAYAYPLKADETSKSVFFPAGEFPSSGAFGDTMTPPTDVRNPQLGETLQRLADEGLGPLIHGELAEALQESSQEAGGILRASDMAMATPDDVRPRSITFRGTTLWGPRAPSGTVTQFQSLRTWEALHPAAPQSLLNAANLADLGDVLQYSFADRYHWLGDPNVVPVPEEGLLSEGYAASLATRIRGREVNPVQRSGEPPWQYFSANAPSDPWRFQKEGPSRPEWSPQLLNHRPAAGTTHVSVIDREGMAVSITHTAASMFGSCFMCPRTGLSFDTSMAWFNPVPGSANSIAPHARPLANMGPMIASEGDVPTLALGAPGGRRIISALVQVVLNLVEQGRDAEDSLRAPRIDASAEKLVLPERLADLVQRLEERNLRTTVVREVNMPLLFEFARPVLVASMGENVFAAVEPGGPGSAAAL